VFDPSGNLYGAASTGGELSACGGSGCGAVFELSPKAGGGWSESVLHVFQVIGGSGYGGARGAVISGLARDTAGNLYGTAHYGGTGASDGNGVVFKLAPGSGGWEETVLHFFKGGTAGGSPITGVTLDGLGNMFGVTEVGGNLSKCLVINSGLGCGVAFEITP
jgi:hypothetical protein